MKYKESNEKYTKYIWKVNGHMLIKIFLKMRNGWITKYLFNVVSCRKMEVIESFFFEGNINHIGGRKQSKIMSQNLKEITLNKQNVVWLFQLISKKVNSMK